MKQVNRLLETNREENILLAHKLLLEEYLFSTEDAFLYVLEFFLEKYYDYSSGAYVFTLGNIFIDFTAGGHDGYGGDINHALDFYVENKLVGNIEVATSVRNNWDTDKKALLDQTKTILPSLLPLV